MINLLFWSDHRILHYAVTYGLLAFLIASTLATPLLPRWIEKKTSPLRSDSFFLAVLCFFLLAAKWPSLFWHRGYSIDEDQFLAAAWALLDDPVFFRSADAASSGPMNIYPLLLPSLFGFLPSLFSSRIVSALIAWGSFSFFYLAAKKFVSEPIARISLLSAAAFYGLTSFWEYCGYASELPPLFFLSFGTWCAAVLCTEAPARKLPSRFYLAAGSVSLSVAPFAKLQSAPLGLLTGIFLILAALSGKNPPFSRPWKTIAFASASAIAFPAAFSLWMLATGCFHYFVTSYFLNAVAYVGEGPSPTLATLWNMALRGEDFPFVFFGNIASATAAFLWLASRLFRGTNSRDLIVLLASSLLVATAIYTVLSPKKEWLHYLLFLPPYSALLAATAASALHRSLSSSYLLPPKNLSTLLAAALFLSSVLPVATFRVIHCNPWNGAAKSWWEESRHPTSKVAQAILAAAEGKKGTLCVWGYNPDYHTETLLRPATRMSIVTPQFNGNSLQDFFRKTFFADLQTAPPLLFVDAAAPSQFPALNDPKYRHESVPEIAEFIASNYGLITEIDGVRIYRNLAPKKNQ